MITTTATAMPTITLTPTELAGGPDFSVTKIKTKLKKTSEIRFLVKVILLKPCLLHYRSVFSQVRLNTAFCPRSSKLHGSIIYLVLRSDLLLKFHFADVTGFSVNHCS